MWPRGDIVHQEVFIDIVYQLSSLSFIHVWIQQQWTWQGTKPTEQRAGGNGLRTQGDHFADIEKGPEEQRPQPGNNRGRENHKGRATRLSLSGLSHWDKRTYCKTRVPSSPLQLVVCHHNNWTSTCCYIRGARQVSQEHHTSYPEHWPAGVMTADASAKEPSHLAKTYPCSHSLVGKGKRHIKVPKE